MNLIRFFEISPLERSVPVPELNLGPGKVRFSFRHVFSVETHYLWLRDGRVVELRE